MNDFHSECAIMRTTVIGKRTGLQIFLKMEFVIGHSTSAIYSKNTQDFSIAFLLFGGKMLLIKVNSLQYGAYGSIGELGSIGENPTRQPSL